MTPTPMTTLTLMPPSSNSALYWAAQMIGGFLIGAICDFPWLSRPKRALLAWAFVFIFGNAVMGGGLAFENLREAHPADWIVFQSSEYAGPAVLYFFYGMLDALWQGVSDLPISTRDAARRKRSRHRAIVPSCNCAIVLGLTCGF
jgi:hypothetical protein